MGCDGIWEQRSHQDMVKWVQKQMNREISNEALLEQLLDETVADETKRKDYRKHKFGFDNMSAILIQFDKK
jgi:serine/threonine protein phosphatase PrpC